jgi:lipid-A-disaccharide synthase
MSQTKKLTFALVAGEFSGDNLGEGMMKTIKARYPQARFVGIGGPRMKAQGLESFFELDELNVMGLVEVLKRLPRLLAVKKLLIEKILQAEPVCYIGIDAPDFNLRVEKILKGYGIPTVHYVSPTIWAWRPKRIFNIAKATHLVLSIFPFEEKIYQRHQFPCRYVGHSLADSIDLDIDQQQAREKLGLTSDDYYLAVLPGSRHSEIKRLSKPFLETLELLRKKEPMKFLIPFASESLKERFMRIKNDVAPELDIIFFEGQSREVMAASDQILLSSGTATLEAMLLKKPMVAAYKLNYLTHKIMKKLYLPEHFSLPNILSKSGSYVPELLQDECSASNLAEAILKQQKQNHDAMYAEFMSIHKRLKKNANIQATEAIFDLVGLPHA